MQVTLVIRYWVKFFDILEEVIEKENNSRDGCWLWNLKKGITDKRGKASAINLGS
jgi:hypothetical protein